MIVAHEEDQYSYVYKILGRFFVYITHTAGTSVLVRSGQYHSSPTCQHNVPVVDMGDPPCCLMCWGGPVRAITWRLSIQ